MDKVLEKVLSGLSDKRIRFDDLIGLSFTERVKGDHHIFTKDNVIEIVNLQPLKDGMSKSYQVKQIRNIILKYNLKI